MLFRPRGGFGALPLIMPIIASLTPTREARKPGTQSLRTDCQLKSVDRQVHHDLPTAVNCRYTVLLFGLGGLSSGFALISETGNPQLQLEGRKTRELRLNRSALRLLE